MRWLSRPKPRYALALAVVGLALVLLLSALRTYRALDEMKAVYLRNRAAAVAARLEALPGSGDPGKLLEELAADEPALLDAALLEPEAHGPDAEALDSIASGRELFRTEIRSREGIFRVYVPLHVDLRTRVARIDLDLHAADFLVVHARHNVVLALVSMVALIVLSLLLLWAGRRAARLERKQIELEHLARLGEMSAVLAHEIRNPLGTIKGFVQLAGEKANDTVKSLLAPVLEEVPRLEKLVSHLLLYGRPAAPVWREVSWDQIAARLQAHAQQVIGPRPIQFLTRGESFLVRTDPDLLHQVLVNLVHNSIEAVPDGRPGRIELAAERRRGGWVIRVTDDGPGLPEEVRRKLFEPFLTTKSFGTGLGLPTARKLAESLGGCLELRPVQPHGTAAVLTFSEGASWKPS